MVEAEPFIGHEAPYRLGGKLHVGVGGLARSGMIHLQPAYRDLHYKPGDFPVAERYASALLSLPIFAELEYEEVEAVVECIHEFYQNLRAIPLSTPEGDTAQEEAPELYSPEVNPKLP